MVGGLVNKFGCRSVAILGSLLSALSLATSTLTTNITVFILVYGVVGGLGFGMVFLPAIVCVGMYFEKRRALATGIAVCGAGVGAFVFAPIANYLVENIGWRYSNLVFSGLCLLNIFCGLAMRPLETVTHITKNEELHETTSTVDRKKSVGKNVDFMPTIGENDVLEDGNDGVHDISRTESNNNSPEKFHHQIQRNMSLNISQDKFSRNFSTPYLRPVSSNLSMMSASSRKESVSRIVRPMSRVDIFYSGSIRQINDPDLLDTETIGLRENRESFVSIGPVHRAGGSSNSLVVPRSSLVDSGSAQLPDNINQPEDDESIMRTIKSMVNLELLKDPKFILIAISNLFGFLGFFVPFLYLPTISSSKDDVSADEAAMLLSVIGISNTVGRIGCGYLSDFAWVDPLVLTNISFFLTGIVIIIFPLLHTFTEFIILSLMFGITIASLVTLTSIVLVDVLGLEMLTSAFGLLIMFRGLATIMGPPIAGMVHQASGSYTMSFNVAGGFLLVAGLISVLADIVRRRQRSTHQPEQT